MSSVKTKWILEFGDKVSAPVKSVGKATRSAKDSADAANRSYRKLKSTVATFVSGYAIMQGVKGMLNLGVAAETTDTKFEVLTGSVSKAQRMLKNIDTFANKTPFDNADLRESAELMLNFGIAQEKVLPIMKTLGDVSGGNKEKFKSLSLAYSQVQSTGRLMGQDLLQMINAGFNPLTVISEKTGRSMAQLKDDMSKGRISADDVTEAFKMATSQGGRFHNMMEKVSETAGGKLSTLMGVARSKVAQFSKNKLVPWLSKALDYGIRFVNGFGKVYNSIVKVLRPIGSLVSAGYEFIKASGLATIAMDFLQGAFAVASTGIEILAGGLETIIKWLTPYAPLIKKVAIAYGAWTLATKGMRTAQVLLNLAMKANPVGLIIVGIAALIGGVKAAYNHFEKFRGFVDGAWASLKGFANMIKNYVIVRFKELLSGITGMGKALYYFFTGSWKKAWQAGKEATKNIIGVDSKKQLVKDAMNLGKDTAAAYDRGVAAIKYKGFNPSKQLAGIMSHKVTPSTSENTAKAPVYTSDSFGNIGANKGTGATAGTSSGGTGSGKSLTMTLHIKNYFNNIKGSSQDVEQVADEIIGKIVDKLRDAEIALG